jgi:hypothetical protein
MLKLSRDAVATGEQELARCSAEKSKYCSICTVTLDPCGDLPFTSWGSWQCLRGGADGLNGCYAACGCGTEYRPGALLGGGACGNILEAIMRIAPSQPNEAMARIASRNGTISFDPSCRVEIPEKSSLDVDSKLFSKVQIDKKKRILNKW